jgi:excisionase family DNA binding protein
MASSLANKLAERGWLSLNELVKYLRADFPERYVSYPTALAMVRENKIRAFTVGCTYRIHREEVTRFIADGNWDPSKYPTSAPISTVSTSVPNLESDQPQSQHLLRPQLRLVRTANLPDELPDPKESET